MPKFGVCFPSAACGDVFHQQTPCQRPNTHREGGGEAHLPPARRGEGQHSNTAAIHPSPPHKHKRELGLLKATGTGCIEISAAIRKSLTNGQESPQPAPTENEVSGKPPAGCPGSWGSSIKPNKPPPRTPGELCNVCSFQRGFQQCWCSFWVE